MLDRLYTEHDHIRKTLNLLEIQFLDLCRDRTPDFSIMRSIVVYIQEYPEQAHHPLEDAIYSKLLDYTENTIQIENLIKDHTELEVTTRQLRESLTSFKDDSSSRENLKNRLSKFLSKQWRHLYFEETVIYPLAKQLLTDADWKHISTIAPYSDDPVFGKRTQNDYEILYREIEKNSRQ